MSQLFLNEHPEGRQFVVTDMAQKRLSSMDSATFAADADGVVAAGELVVNQETALTPAMTVSWMKATGGWLKRCRWRGALRSNRRCVRCRNARQTLAPVFGAIDEGDNFTVGMGISLGVVAASGASATDKRRLSMFSAATTAPE